MSQNEDKQPSNEHIITAHEKTDAPFSSSINATILPVSERGSVLARLNSFLHLPSNWLFAALCILMCLALTTPPTLSGFAPGNTMLDASWQACNAYFLRHHLRAGIDFVFPTWLLGYFYGNVYDRSLYWFYYVWQLLLAGCLSMVIAHFALRFPSPAKRLATLLICYVTLTLLREDMLYFILLLLTGSILLFSSQSQPRQCLLILLLLVLISLLKFSFLAVAVVVVVFASVHNGLFHAKTTDTKVRKAKQWAAFYIPLLTVLLFLGIWLLLGQHITDIPQVLRNESVVSAGYNETMGIAGTTLTLFLGVTLTVLFGLLLVTTRKPDGVNPISGTMMLAMVAAPLWKLSFVRSDGGHVTVFFGTLLILTLLLPVYFGLYTVQPLWHRRLSWACILVSAMGIVSARGVRYTMTGWERYPLRNAAFVFTPWLKQQQLDTQQEQLQSQWHLPSVQAAVGNTTVDVVSYKQEVAFLNNLNLRPRPVYQGYSAYTPFLCALNADFYRSPRAPAFVLFRLETIDKRLPALDDSLTLLELLRSYHPLLVEKGFTLLARNTHSPAASSQTLPVQRLTDVRFGQDITFADDAPFHLLTVHVRPTLRGKLKSALLRASALTIDIQTEEGRTAHYLLPPAMAESTTLLDPLLQNSRDVVRLYGGLPSKRVHSFRLQCGSPSLFQQPFEVTLTPSTGVVGEQLPPAQANSLLAPALWPAAAEAPARF